MVNIQGGVNECCSPANCKGVLSFSQGSSENLHMNVYPIIIGHEVCYVTCVNSA